MQRVRPLKFVHVVYRTRRFAEMVRWYQRVFDVSELLRRRTDEPVSPIRGSFAG